MGARTGRPPKLRPEHAGVVQDMLNDGAERSAIARQLEVTPKTLLDFCQKHGIERRMRLKDGIPPERLTEATSFGNAYLAGLPRRMKRQGIRWSVADQERMLPLILEKAVACLNSYDPLRGKSLKVFMAGAFKRALATHLAENLERAARHIDHERVGVMEEPGGPEDIPERRYVVADPSSKRIGRDSDNDARPGAACDKMKPDAVQDVLDGMRNPNPSGVKRTFPKTRLKLCPHCRTGVRGKPVTFSEPGGLQIDDSRRTPCPYCYGRGLFTDPVYISEGDENSSRSEAYSPARKSSIVPFQPRMTIAPPGSECATENAPEQAHIFFDQGYNKNNRTGGGSMSPSRGTEWKDFFREHGVTQHKVAQRVGYSVPSVGQYLNEYRPMPSHVLREFQRIREEVLAGGASA